MAVPSVCGANGDGCGRLSVMLMIPLSWMYITTKEIYNFSLISSPILDSTLGKAKEV